MSAPTFISTLSLHSPFVNDIPAGHVPSPGEILLSFGHVAALLALLLVVIIALIEAHTSSRGLKRLWLVVGIMAGSLLFLLFCRR